MKNLPLLLALVLLWMGCPIKDTILTVHHFAGAKAASSDWRQCMQGAAYQSGDRNAIERSVIIERPIGAVYEFYRDFRNLPTFLGDVMSIEQTSPGTSWWTIQGPLHIRTHWAIKVTKERTNQLICYETVSSPILRTRWEVYFSPGRDAGQTEVREILRSPLGRLGRAALGLIGKFPAEEVSANLRRLKQVLEIGRVTDTSYSIRGKFSQH
jgi:uncharacterized membrane protein